MTALDVDGVRWLDVFGLSILVLFTLLGIRRGLWWQVVRLLGLVCALAVARATAPALGTKVHALTELGSRVSHGLAWTAIFVAGLLVVALIGRIGRASLEAVQLGWLDRLGGAIAGFVSGAVIFTGALLCMCQVLPDSFLRDALRGSRSERLLAAVERGVPVLLDARAAASVRTYVPD
jgi:uncharacterized membrane protein required for colicin V production